MISGAAATAAGAAVHLLHRSLCHRLPAFHLPEPLQHHPRVQQAICTRETEHIVEGAGGGGGGGSAGCRTSFCRVKISGSSHWTLPVVLL